MREAALGRSCHRALTTECDDLCGRCFFVSLFARPCALVREIGFGCFETLSKNNWMSYISRLGGGGSVGDDGECE